MQTTCTTLRISRFSAFVTLYFGAPLFLVIAGLGVIGILAGMVAAMVQDDRSLNLASYPLAMLVMAGLIWFSLNLFRFRESFFTVFTVTPDGIRLENARYGALNLGWSDITRAHLSRLPRFIVVESPRLARPIAIMNWEVSESSEFAMARSTIRAAMAEKWSEGRI